MAKKDVPWIEENGCQGNLALLDGMHGSLSGEAMGAGCDVEGTVGWGDAGEGEAGDEHVGRQAEVRAFGEERTLEVGVEFLVG